MKRFKSLTALILALVLVTGTVSGCGANNANAGTATTDSAQSSDVAEPEAAEPETSEPADGDDSAADSAAAGDDMPFAGVTVTYAVSETAAVGAENLELVELVREKTGINLEFTIIPNTNAGEVDKRLVMLQAGDELGILYNTTPGLKAFQDAGVLTPVDDLAAAQGYDMKAIYGDSLPVMMDGKAYGLPAFNDIWLVMYNKKIFDDAGVPYPTAEGFTWSKYVETAKLLTDSSQDIWGSFMLDYDCYNYLYATQKGAQPYKSDGTANFDDPLYQEGLEWFYGLGNVEKIQPDAITYAAGVYPWNAFMANGNMGMWLIGGWATSMLPNVESYPRDWTAGIVPMPYPDGESPSTLSVTGCYAIPSTAANPEASFEAIKVMAEYQYTLGYGRVPARIDLTDEEIESYISEALVPNYTVDGLTVEDFKACWFDTDRKILSEKIVGPASTAISQIWIEEGQLYGQGGKALADAVTALKERSDQAIQEEIASNS